MSSYNIKKNKQLRTLSIGRGIDICKRYENIFIDMLDSINEAFCYIDTKWKLIFANSATEKYLAVPKDQLLGDNVWKFFSKNFSLDFQERLKKAATEKNSLQFEEYYPPLNNWYEVRVYSCRYGLAVYFNDITERKRNDEYIRYLAFHDSLTGIPNRVLLQDRLENAIARAKRNNEVLAVMYLDLDNFKQVNNTLGHHAGDFVLQNVAKRLTNCLREGDTVARMGGDEFIILLPNIETKDNVALVANRIIETMQQPLDLNRQEFYVTTSIGISNYPDDSRKRQELLIMADTALYRAKKAGKNNFKFYNPCNHQSK
ncbi:diguanylate cyclase [Peptococcaceae bacterium 1198_IL3148]